jgi:AcrR family transcriptional regulator
MSREPMSNHGSQKAKGSAWVADPLPRGRHKLPREEVQASQRERLLRAMAELVGDRGYERTSVPQVIAAARVSSNTFYRFFSDKTDCFIALCEQLGEELFAELDQPPDTAEGVAAGLAALDRGIRSYLRWWQDRPALARAYFIELPAAGPRALDERESQYARFEAVHRRIAERARILYPEAPPLRDVDVSAAVIVTTQLVEREVRAGRVDQVSAIEGDLRYLLLKLLVGVRAAELVAESSAHTERD